MVAHFRQRVIDLFNKSLVIGLCNLIPSLFVIVVVEVFGLGLLMVLDGLMTVGVAISEDMVAESFGRVNAC